MRQLTDRENEILERTLRETLKERADALKTGPEDAERMCRAVNQRIEEEGSMRRRWNISKTAAVTAAICIIGAMTAVAAGKGSKTFVQIHKSGRPTLFYSFPSHDDEFTQYSQLTAAENEIGFDVKAPETFSNGYRFVSGVPVYSQGQDESGNVVQEQQDLSLTYSKEGQKDLYLDVSKSPLMDEESAWDQTEEHGGITLGYSSNHYRMVPPDYEMTAEEIAQSEAGDLMIAYGSDKITDQTLQSLSWEDNGHLYTLFGFDTGLSPEDFYQMAGEIIDGK